MNDMGSRNVIKIYVCMTYFIANMPVKHGLYSEVNHRVLVRTVNYIDAVSDESVAQMPRAYACCNLNIQ